MGVVRAITYGAAISSTTGNVVLAPFTFNFKNEQLVIAPLKGDHPVVGNYNEVTDGSGCSNYNLSTVFSDPDLSLQSRGRRPLRTPASARPRSIRETPVIAWRPRFLARKHGGEHVGASLVSPWSPLPDVIDRRPRQAPVGIGRSNRRRPGSVARAGRLRRNEVCSCRWRMRPRTANRVAPERWSAGRRSVTAEPGQSWTIGSEAMLLRVARGTGRSGSCPPGHPQQHRSEPIVQLCPGSAVTDRRPADQRSGATLLAVRERFASATAHFVSPNWPAVADRSGPPSVAAADPDRCLPG